MTSGARASLHWQGKASAVAEALALDRLHPAVLAWAAKRRKADVWCVAFSGGADSLALLLLLWAHWPERRGQLVALHFNHRLRGRASDADEKFCRAVCEVLRVRLCIGRWDRTDGAGISEAQARGARHDFFAQKMRGLGAKALWLAHQQDDIAESMLMRLARGSGSAGLAAPRPVQATADGRVHVRPLLTLKKSELTAVLRDAGAKWREDASNAGGDFFRNRVRLAVLPAWNMASSRDALACAALSRERLEEDDDALEHWVTSLAVLQRGQLDVRLLAGLPRAVVRRALHRWLLALANPVDLSRQGFEVLLAAVEAGGATRFSLGKHGFAVIADGGLRFRKSR